MSERGRTPSLPACYATVAPGLEEVAAEEIQQRLGGDIKRTGKGVVVFRLDEVTDTVLRLRTVDDVFLLAWGTDELTYRAKDLESIRRWTAHEANWTQLLQVHHRVRPKPKGKPTYHLVTQMRGEHGYRRADARKALAKGLVGKFPESWRYAEENASIEVWLTIQGATAVCGLRLSDATMRHRTYKLEHLPASLRPTVAAALVRLADIQPGNVVLDPMCGAGTLLAEARWAHRPPRPREEAGPDDLSEEALPKDVLTVLGGDLDASAVRAASVNLRRLPPVFLARWDAGCLPLASESVDRLISNPPFGKQLSTPEEVGPLYRRITVEFDRVLRPGGKTVLVVSEPAELRDAIRAVGWYQRRQLRVRILGQPAVVSVFKKPDRTDEDTNPA